MFERDELLHLVFWPKGDVSSGLDVLNKEGEVLGGFPIVKPMRGFDLQRLVPGGYCIKPFGCAVFGLAGALVTITETPFDSAVVTEKREETFEDRFAKLEGRVRRAEQREAKLAKQNSDLLAERARAASEAAQAERGVRAASDEVPPPDDAQQPPEAAQEGTGDE